MTDSEAELRKKIIKIIDTYGYDELPTAEATANAIMSLIAAHDKTVEQAAQVNKLENIISEWEYRLKQSQFNTIDFAFSPEDKKIYAAEQGGSYDQWKYCIEYLKKELAALQTNQPEEGEFTHG